MKATIDDNHNLVIEAETPVEEFYLQEKCKIVPSTEVTNCPQWILIIGKKQGTE